MFKVDDIQNYGKEQFETAVATATGVQNGLNAIASAYGDYAKKSYEDTKSFVEELSGVRTPDKALERRPNLPKAPTRASSPTPRRSPVFMAIWPSRR